MYFASSINRRHDDRTGNPIQKRTLALYFWHISSCWFVHATKCKVPHGYRQKISTASCSDTDGVFPFAALGTESAAHPRYYSIKRSQQREQWASLKPALCLSAADSARQLEWGAETSVGHPHKVSLAGLQDVSAASPRRCLQMSLVTIKKNWTHFDNWQAFFSELRPTSFLFRVDFHFSLLDGWCVTWPDAPDGMIHTSDLFSVENIWKEKFSSRRTWKVII